MISTPHQFFTGKPFRALSAGILVFLIVLVRVVYPGSDAYARLTWSSALLTDEGFYIHNARNLVLFGHARTDEFNNALIMPLLHLAQVLVFRVWGVGAMQARSISIVASLLTLVVLCDALRRIWGLRCAWLCALLLGLDPAFALYNRLALMDTPACLPLCLAFWLWTLAQTRRQEEGDKCKTGRQGDGRNETTRPQDEQAGQEQPVREASASLSPCLPVSLSPPLPLLPLFLCGLCLGLAYCVRGLTAVVAPVPLLLLAREAWHKYKQDKQEQTDGATAGASPPNIFSSKPLLSLYALLAGLALVLLAYVVLWYLPNKTEMAHVNAYYLNHQLRPNSIRHLWQNVQRAFFGDERGVAPYLFRHSPVTFALALLCLFGQEKPVSFSLFLSPFSYLRLWLLLMWALLAVINYAPDRYYILFYPAMCALAALALCDVHALLGRVGQVWWKRAGLGGFLAYHLGEAFLHHDNRTSEICLYAFTALILLALALPLRNVSQWRERNSVSGSQRYKQRSAVGQTNVMRFLPVVFLTAWAIVTALWLSDWLRHIRYAQRDADQWLMLHLPADSVLIGDASPGLCLNNRFPVVCVIPGLCNDDQPVEQYAPASRYIVILDDGERYERFKEPWWRKNYPALVAPGHRIHYVPRIVRFPVGIYAVSPPEPSQ